MACDRNGLAERSREINDGYPLTQCFDIRLEKENVLRRFIPPITQGHIVRLLVCIIFEGTKLTDCVAVCSYIQEPVWDKLAAVGELIARAVGSATRLVPVVC